MAFYEIPLLFVCGAYVVFIVQYFAKMDEKKAKEDEDPKAKAMREAVEKISK
jgi:hypothetical protein